MKTSESFVSSATSLLAVWLLGGLPAPAQTATQTFSLQPGWNAVYLNLTPTNPAPSEVFAGLSLESAWMFQDRATTVDFIQDPMEPVWNSERWSFFAPTNRPESRLNRLFAIFGQRAFLLKVTNAATWTVTGTAALVRTEWVPEAYNLVGFPLSETAPPTFEAFFKPSAAHYNSATRQLQPIYRMSSAGQWALAAPGAPMKAGEACWVFCKGGSDYQAPLTVRLETGAGLDFGEFLDEQTLQLSNLSASPTTVTLQELRGTGGTALSYYEFDPAIGATWPALPPTLAYALSAGSNLTVRLAIRRTAMTGTNYATLLAVNSSAGVRCLVPVTASKSATAVLGGPPDVEARGHAGLWVGSASITAVSEAHSGWLVTNSYDSAGKPLVVERVGFNPVTQPVHSPATLRLLVHVDTNGTARLLKEAIQMAQAPVYTNDLAGNQVLAVPGRSVLLTEKSLIPNFTGIVMRDNDLVGVRYSTVAYDFPGTSLPFSGRFALSQTLRVTNTLPKDWPTNPFRHKYNPDHKSEQSYDITRAIALEISPPPTNAPPEYGDRRLDGIYRETVTGLHQTNIIASGTFTLQRVSKAGVLNQ